MPSLTPAELQEARRKSGRLGGRPRKPTVEEARRTALDELVPKALRVLNEHLDKGGPDAWRAALRIFEHQYGRAPEQPEEPFACRRRSRNVQGVASGVNASGQIIGSSTSSTGSSRAVMWTTQTDTSPPVGSPSTADMCWLR